ncbi:hypothetical protein CGCSCA4_v012957 [Colletotrichum siamense]|uniref:Uncharacterized protein n=1 Tax=Colletotrichum siamense TaxID=690259 RepID=A0A9P5BR90_COLSI|nr:hypothetical protein CGCSCA4_v012957 [Colletotrichum siamense]KAF4848789.1 hypothetical protein CGCSCA2_v012184 [Colletotrichum siamense]
MTQVNPHHFRKSLITITSANVDLVDPSYPTGNIYTGGTLQVKGRLKPAEWDLIPSHCAYESQTYQVTCEGFLASRHSLTGTTEKPDLWTDVDTLSPGLNKLKISLLPIAVFIERQDDPETPAPVFVEGLVLTLKDPAARKYERVGRFSAAERLAAYLFLNGLPKEKTKASSEHHQKRIWEYRGKVEGFSFQGTRKWTRIPESDIVIV